jgi:hypothetical protein
MWLPKRQIRPERLAPSDSDQTTGGEVLLILGVVLALGVAAERLSAII